MAKLNVWDDWAIQNYMSNVINDYENLREVCLDSNKACFWDAVIISASDEKQRNGYLSQIEYKIEQNDFPLPISFHVIADPPGCKIGCGGSTMFILQEIQKIYGKKMFDMRFLLIHAGGYSQRLPNLCVLGKIFSPLPYSKRNIQMLDLILAIYLPFLARMPPGVFLASSDAVISFSMDDNDNWTFENDGFTALAHPSPVSIGTSHGVYVLPNIQESSGSTMIEECSRVLQKPSIDDMTDKGAITKVGDKEVVYSDSAFFFDHNITKKLISFYKVHNPLECELSSYGDFLQPLGSSASPSYIVNSSSLDEKLATLRTALYRELFGIKLSVLVLKNSNFHHLGTMKEYIDCLCGRNVFSAAFSISKFSASSLSTKCIKPLYIHGTVTNSIINPLSAVSDSTILEFCNINVVIDVGPNCIISNIQLDGFLVERLPIPIPPNSLFHTVQLNNDYVTIACNIEDDIKQPHSIKDCREVVFFTKKLKCFIRPDDVKTVFKKNSDHVSLWSAKLFPVCGSADKSFRLTLGIVSRILTCGESYCDIEIKRDNALWVSMADVLSMKDTDKMLQYQKDLMKSISNDQNKL